MGEDLRPNSQVRTERLALQPPAFDDVDLMFERYASDPEVTRYLSWPIHRTVEDTRAFVEASEAEWAKWPAGPYLIWAMDSPVPRLVGSTGLHFASPHEASTGYVLARDSWGKGYASEALHTMVDVAMITGVRRLTACCHPDNRRSIQVLEKEGFRIESRKLSCCFPNLPGGEKVESLLFAYVF